MKRENDKAARRKPKAGRGVRGGKFWMKCRNFDYESLLTFSYISKHPQRQLLLGYLSYIVMATLLLSMPFSRTDHVSTLDNIFTSASAVSTTGLATVDIANVYTFFGQLVILLCIQLGGIGYMTVSSFVMFRLTKHFTAIKSGILNAEFTTPGGIKLHSLLHNIIGFTLAFEVAGAIALYFLFDAAGIDKPLWPAIFHSVSSFCTAGFSTFSNGLVDFVGNWGINVTIMILSYAGAMGFIVMTDVWKKLTVKGYKVTFTTKNIIVITLLLTVWGTIQLYFGEPHIEAFPSGKRFLVSLFQTVSALTTVGFNTINLGGLLPIALLALVTIMYFGASPSGTGGGLKSTTVSAIAAFVKCKLGRERNVYLMGRKLPTFRVDNALVTFVLYTSVLFFGSYFLTLVEPGNDYIPYLFEAASALGTVGLSTGITPELGAAGKWIIITLMYIGRVGVLTIGYSMLRRMQRHTGQILKADDLAV